MTSREARELARRLVHLGILTVETYRGSGPGGQHRNRTESGVKLTGRWALNGKPLVLRAQACMKSQHASMRAALMVLIAKHRAAVAAARAPARVTPPGFGPAGRIRTYHEPDNRVVDESGVRSTWSATVGKLDLEALIDGRRRALEESGT